MKGMEEEMVGGMGCWREPPEEPPEGEGSPKLKASLKSPTCCD